eukprot:163798_1
MEEDSELPGIPELDESHIFGVPTNTQPRLSGQHSRFQPPHLHNIMNHGTMNGNTEPLEWDQFFDERSELVAADGKSKFCYYEAGKGNGDDVCFLFLHGAGMGALSFAPVAKLLKETCRCLAFDFRGHGLSDSRGKPEDLSIETLTEDAAYVVSQILPASTQIVVVGHSMGGALGVRLTYSGKLPNICGLAVIDVVEGTALAALVHMNDVVRRRPKSFPSVLHAIQWACNSHTIRNVQSARVSIPAQLVRTELESGNCVWRWRTNLMASEPHWHGWYTGLSEQFLACKVAKILLLAGTDRLDKPLTIAQMQGKFEMVVIPDSGHVMQEDVPDNVADRLAHFVKRNRFAEMAVLNAKMKGNKAK